MPDARRLRLAPSLFLGSLLTLCLGTPADARNVEPRALGLSLVAGPSWRLEETLGGDVLFATVGLMAEWSLSKHASVVVDILESPRPTSSVTRGHVGVKLRRADLLLTLSPYVLAEVGAAGLFNFLGANLLAYSARVGLGVDYMFSRHVSAGAAGLIDLGASAGLRPTFFGLFEPLLVVTYTLP